MRVHLKRITVCSVITAVVLGLLTAAVFALLALGGGDDGSSGTVVIPYRIDGRKSDDSAAALHSVSIFKMINHRGFSAEAPENTLPAVRLSKKKGFRYVETDVQFTGDGVPVCLHDRMINRTARTPGGGRLAKQVCISDITYMQAMEYDFGIWKSPAYRDTKIMSFEKFIEACRDLDLYPYIEMKLVRNHDPEEIVKIVNIVKKYDMMQKATFLGFEYNDLDLVKSLCGSARIGVLYNRQTPLHVTRILELMTEDNEIFVDAKLDFVSDVLNTCKHNCIPVEVWGVDDSFDLTELDRYISGATVNCMEKSASSAPR